MPNQPPPGPLLRRRTALGAVLTAGVAAGTAGCTRGVDMRPARGRSAQPVEATPDVEPDVALAGTVLADEQAVLDRVRATAEAFPALAKRLAPAEEAHRRHVELLTDAVPDPSPSPSVTAVTGGASPEASPSASPTPHVPRDRAKALAALARAEDALTLSAKRAAFAAESGAFARVLASMAASAAQQAALLRGRDGGAA